MSKTVHVCVCARVLLLLLQLNVLFNLPISHRSAQVMSGSQMLSNRCLTFYRPGYPSYHPTNSVKALTDYEPTFSLSLSVLTAPELAGTRMSPLWTLLELRKMEVMVTTGAI